MSVQGLLCVEFNLGRIAEVVQQQASGLCCCGFESRCVHRGDVLMHIGVRNDANS